MKETNGGKERGKEGRKREEGKGGARRKRKSPLFHTEATPSAPQPLP